MSTILYRNSSRAPDFGTGLRSRVEQARSSEVLLAILPEIEPRPVPLGELVVEAGLLSQGDLTQALGEAVERRRRLGEVLLEQKYVSSAELARLLGEQRGLPFLDLTKLAPDREAARLMPAPTVRIFRTLPVGFAGGLPVVAVGDPTDELAMARARAFVRNARFVASADEEILARLEALGL